MVTYERDLWEDAFDQKAFEKVFDKWTCKCI